MTNREKARRLAAKYGISKKATIITIAKMLGQANFDEWFSRFIFRRTHNLSPNTRLYGSNGDYLTAEQVLRKTPMSWSLACRRLYLWEQGKITKEDIFVPAKKYMGGNPIKPVNQPRDEMLDKIPGPTQFEKEHPEIFGG